MKIVFLKKILNKFNKLIKKEKMAKIVVGKKYRVIKTPVGMTSSGGTGTGGGNLEVLINSKNTGGEDRWNSNNGSWYYGYELKSLEPYTKEEILESIKEVESEIRTKNSEISNLKSKLKFMEENGLEEFDEDQFKVFRTLELIDSKELSKMEMAKEIAKLISGK
jgi:hypothetical protein